MRQHFLSASIESQRRAWARSALPSCLERRGHWIGSRRSRNCGRTWGCTSSTAWRLSIDEVSARARRLPPTCSLDRAGAVEAKYLAREPRGRSACRFGQVHLDRGARAVSCGLLNVHRAAMRYAVKLLLRDLWLAWHVNMPNVNA